MDAYTTLLRLKSAYPHAEPRVYYRLACAAFRVRRYKEANALFDELQDLGKVIEFTIRGHEFVEDDAGKPASFPGRVAGFEPGGNGRIECEAFEEPFRTVPFIQRFVRIPLQPGDRVSFFTYFNYRGPYARDISRVAHG